jgi:flagellin
LLHNLQEVTIMVVQHNLTAINANRYYGINNNKLSKSLEKLSSGYAINRAGDNAAGLAVSEKMRAQISGITQAVTNAQDGISMTQTFEGALTETDSILQRMRSLAVQSANGTYDNSVDRTAIQQEFNQLNDELNQIADTDYNGVVVLNGGTMADGVSADGYGNIDYSTTKREAQQLGSSSGVQIATRDVSVPNNATVTFTATVSANGTVTWTAGGGSVTGASLSMNSSNGGFSYAGVVVSVDTTKVVSGDTITIDFTSGTTEAKQTAEVTGYNEEVTDGVISDTTDKTTLTINWENDDISNASKAAAVNALNGLTIRTVVGADGSTTAEGTASSTTVNGVALSSIAKDDKADLMELDDGSKLTIDADGKIYYVAKDGTEAADEVASIKTFAKAGDGSSAGTITTKAVVSTASYTPNNNGSAKLVEPESVSKADSNSASTAKLTYSNSITLQVGARTKDSVNFTLSYTSDGIGDLNADLNCTADGLGTSSLSLATQEEANAAIDQIDNAINKVSMVRGTFGALQNRLEHKIDNLNTTNENLTSAESRIRDTDMATEMMNFTKNQILAQASQSMLAQANQLPQGVLSLLQ